MNAGGATQPVIVTSPVHKGRKAGQVNNDVDHGANDVANGFAQALPSFSASNQISLSAWVFPIAGFEEFELGPGDSITFDAQMPHRLWTIGRKPAEAIWVVYNRHGDSRTTKTKS